VTGERASGLVKTGRKKRGPPPLVEVEGNSSGRGSATGRRSAAGRRWSGQRERGRGEGETGEGRAGHGCVCVVEKEGVDIYNKIVVCCCSPLRTPLNRLILPFIPLFHN